jgi:folate-dependent phosphoribosylglycinamide formyltransferase PurN
MHKQQQPPSVVLICHEGDRIDREALASWLASTFSLAGFIIIRDGAAHLWRAARRELRRAGALGFLDVLAFRAYARLRLAARDNRWKLETVRRFRERYAVDLDAVPRLFVRSPNDDDARRFLAQVGPDLVIARCKFILKRQIFDLPRVGTFVLHPGVCPEYRNAHGCFWALVNRDVRRVGMTLLRVDAGVDTGPIYLQAGSDIDECEDSHTVIQSKVVLDNLDAIGRVLADLSHGVQVAPMPTLGRSSAVWGQPRLSAYLRWKRAARDARDQHAPRLPAVS